MIDCYTYFPEAVVISDFSSVTVVTELTKTIPRFDYPLEAITDNGRQFEGQLFESFIKSCGVIKSFIKSCGVKPYYQKSNGKIEINKESLQNNKV